MALVFVPWLPPMDFGLSHFSGSEHFPLSKRSSLSQSLYPSIFEYHLSHIRKVEEGFGQFSSECLISAYKITNAFYEHSSRKDRFPFI